MQYKTEEKEIARRTNSEMVKRVETIYQVHQHQMAAQKAIHQKQAMQMVLFVILAVLLVSGLLALHSYRNRRRQKKQQYQRLLLLQEAKLSNQLVAEKEADGHQHSYEKREADHEKARAICLHFINPACAINEFVEKGNTGNEKWKTLEEAVNLLHDHFTQKLYTYCAHLSYKQLRVCLLTRIGAKPHRIASLLQLSDSGVGSIKRRLYSSIFGQNGSTKDFDEFIRDL